MIDKNEEKLKISIITPSFNQGRFIKDTIESVLGQEYDNFEHIVIDGNSTDDTAEILKSYPHLKWVSEKDKGAAEAINKGVRMATGDVMTWLNADDYFEPNIFQCISDLFGQHGLKSLIMGSMTYVDEEKNVLWVDNNHRITRDSLIHESADLLRQPCTFFPISVFNEVGGLDEDLKLVFDYDIFIKMLSQLEPVYIESNFAYQRDYKETLSRRFVRRQALEIFRVSRRNGSGIFDKIHLSGAAKVILKKVWNLK